MRMCLCMCMCVVSLLQHRRATRVVGSLRGPRLKRRPRREPLRGPRRHQPLAWALAPLSPFCLPLSLSLPVPLSLPLSSSLPLSLTLPLPPTTGREARNCAHVVARARSNNLVTHSHFVTKDEARWGWIVGPSRFASTRGCRSHALARRQGRLHVRPEDEAAAAIDSVLALLARCSNNSEQGNVHCIWNCLSQSDGSRQAMTIAALAG